MSALPAAIALAAGLMGPRTGNSEAAQTPGTPGAAPKWDKVSVALPVSQVQFPAGEGSVIANSYCLICHSAGMVLRQPPLTQDEWSTEVNKMRNAFGAPLPADQVEALAKYLYGLNGQSKKGASAADEQGS